jgi:ABC-type nitrate/sulfonate/bicarbonate transport system substrate-binding protein
LFRNYSALTRLEVVLVIVVIVLAAVAGVGFWQAATVAPVTTTVTTTERSVETRTITQTVTTTLAPGAPVTVTQTLTVTHTTTQTVTQPITTTHTITTTVTGTPKPTQKVKIAWHQSTLEMMSAYALEAGFFAEEGLDVELVFFPSGALAIRSVIAGDVDGYDGAFASSLALAVAGGAPLKGVLQLIDKPLIRAVVKRDSPITHPSQLEGKILAISRFGSGSHGVALGVLTKYGIDPKKVTIIEAGGATEIIAVVEKGEADVGFTWDPAAETAIQKGIVRLLFNAWEEIPNLEPMLLIFKEEFIKKNPDTIKAICRAYARALDAAREKPVDLLNVAKKYLPAVEEGILRVALDNARLNLYSLTGGFKDDAIRGSINFLEKSRLIKPGLTVDDLIIRGFYP